MFKGGDSENGRVVVSGCHEIATEEIGRLLERKPEEPRGIDGDGGAHGARATEGSGPIKSIDPLGTRGALAKELGIELSEPNEESELKEHEGARGDYLMRAPPNEENLGDPMLTDDAEELFCDSQNDDMDTGLVEASALVNALGALIEICQRERNTKLKEIQEKCLSRWL